MSRLNATIQFVVLLLLLGQALAMDVTKFCKCTCGQNSTILELTKFALSHLPHATEPIDVDTLMPNVCMNCTKLLCGLAEPDLCDGAAVDDDYVPLCFQRDSVQDKLIVVGFLVLVGTLLVWSAVRSRVGPIFERVRNQYGYNVVAQT
ncbi:hypothetical protein LPJ58_001892 [Coemansia sp. RSA 1591]|nr:hypothetical protein LPJ58_001892 [Coemansia sp. RSA 1591]KAJ2546565.1 hypothetical protein IWW35_004974 [Coemansia sp. RSA 1878]KAJ2835511.1 hypothetical protein J3B01_003454 [Coemansia erecta]